MSNVASTTKWTRPEQNQFLGVTHDFNPQTTQKKKKKKKKKGMMDPE